MTEKRIEEFIQDEFAIQNKKPDLKSSYVTINLEQNMSEQIQQATFCNQFPVLQNCLINEEQETFTFAPDNEQKMVYLIVPNDENITNNTHNNLPTLFLLPKETEHSTNEIQYVIQTNEINNDNKCSGNDFYKNIEDIRVDQPQQISFNNKNVNIKSKNLKICKTSNTRSGNFKLLKCDIKDCNEFFSSAYEKKNHMESHLFPENTEYKCGICNAIFSKASERNKHIDSHSIPDTFKCRSCQKSFPYYTALVKHADEQKCNSSKPLICLFCGVRFLSQNDLKIHQEFNVKVCDCKAKVCGETAFITHKSTCNNYIKKRNRSRKVNL